MPNTYESLGVRVSVSERSGLRRFLYPLSVKLPAVYKRLVSHLALADENGHLVPAIANVERDGTLICRFALSMDPLARRTLSLVRLTDDDMAAPIPDPIAITQDETNLTSAQERVAFKVDAEARLSSVVYDNVEHLAGPLSITLNGKAPQPSLAPIPLLQSPAEAGLYAVAAQIGTYGGEIPCETRLDLTCCKSWITVRHILLSGAPASATVTMRLPLTVSSNAQTCDFGLQNGAYGKLQPGLIDGVTFSAYLREPDDGRYEIASLLPSGQARIDYAGRAKSVSDLLSRLWLHWNEPTKALALAVTSVPKSCERIDGRIDGNGIVELSFALQPSGGQTAEIGVCYHFLNDIPPIAAATNPASILFAPVVSVERIM